MEFEYEIKGYEEIRAALLELPKRISRNVLKRSVSAAAATERTFQRIGAPVRKGGGAKRISWSKGAPKYNQFRYPGFLKKKVQSFYRNRVSSPTEVHYGVAPVGDAYYGYIVARGHVIGKRMRKSTPEATRYNASLKRVPAHDWITPVWNATKYNVEKELNQKLTDNILKEGEKLGFKKSYGWHFG